MTTLQLVAKYGPLRSNSNRLALELLRNSLALQENVQSCHRKRRGFLDAGFLSVYEYPSPLADNRRSCCFFWAADFVAHNEASDRVFY
jgi:hypothetical protein